MTTKIQEAITEYLKLKNRKTHPEGTFDKGGRFYLAESEKHDCCRGIRSPSRAYPYSEMKHARTLKHVAHKYNVLESECRKALREMK
jgi:hypothetical protein